MTKVSRQLHAVEIYLRVQLIAIIHDDIQDNIASVALERYIRIADFTGF